MKDFKEFFLMVSHPYGLVLKLVFLAPLHVLIYINYLSDGITSNVKLFADDTFIFSTIHDINYSASNLNPDLQKISEWVFKWKMSINPDPTKQAQEVVFSRKMIKPSHPLIKLNNLPVQNASSQKLLGLILDEKLNFESHLKENLIKALVLFKICKISCQDKHF